MANVRAFPVLRSLAMVVVAVTTAYGVAVAGHRLIGAGPIEVAAVVAVVVSGVFAWRLAEGLSSFAIVVLLSGTVEHWSQADLRYIDELALPLMAVTAFVAHRTRLTIPRPGLREAALVVMFLAGILSSLLNAVPATVWVSGLGLLAKGFGFFYLVHSLRVAPDELRRIIGVVFAISLVIAAIGLIQVVAPDVARSVFRLPPVDQQRGEIQVVNAVFSHPALYGWLTVFVSLFLFARFAVLREWWALALATALGISSIFSARRAPAVGLAAGVLVGIVRQATATKELVRVLIPAVAVGAIVVAVSVPLLGDFYRRTFTEYGVSPEWVTEILSDSPDPAGISGMPPRVALYVGSVAIARDQLPFGAGLGRYGSHMSREIYSPVYADYGLDQLYGLREAEPIAVTDTFWPMILGETGVVGLLGMIAFITLLGRDLWRVAAARAGSVAQAFVFGALLVFAESLVRSLISAVYVAPPIAYFVFGAAGISLSLAGGPDD
jgi:hypothetical protein